jgi:hypothetical protein
MYEGVDTVILSNELAYQDQLPVAFRPLRRLPEDAETNAFADRNVRILQVCAALEDHGTLEKQDETAPPSTDLARLEVKVNLLLELVGQLLAAHTRRPEPVMVRFNALGAQWKANDLLRVGEQGLLEIWLRESLPQPITFAAHITHVAADGNVKASFAPPGEATADLIEKLAFRRHRRQVAGARKPRRT